MEQKFKFGLFSSFLARLRSNRPGYGSFCLLKKRGEVSKLQKIAAQLSSKNTKSALELSERDKYHRVLDR